MQMEELFFEATDGLELSGLLYTPIQKTNKVIVSVHGMASNCMKKRDYIIAQQLSEDSISYFCFNNRGHDLISYSRKPMGEKKKTILIGTSYENILESYHDIKGALKTVMSLGYTEIYLQGHSLGCTKIIYTYHQLIKNKEIELLESIKALLLLSLIDIQGIQKQALKDKFITMLTYANQKEVEGKLTELMPNHAFIWPISVQTYLQYFRDNQAINFARYSDNEYQFDELNSIRVPLLMRWGSNELITQEPEQLVELMRKKIKQERKDITYIEGAGHNYREKERELANQIQNFIRYI